MPGAVSGAVMTEEEIMVQCVIVRTSSVNRYLMNVSVACTVNESRVLFLSFMLLENKRNHGNE